MASINYNELSSYDDCVKRLGGRDSRALRYAVRLVRDGADITVVHHSTPIIRYRPDGSIVLDCRKYRSITTKANLNRYTGFYVWQKDFTWHISDSVEGEKVFADGMTFAGQPSRDYVDANTPDVLEALIGLTGELDRLGLADVPGDTMADLRNRVDEAQTAIDKARECERVSG